MIDEQPGLKRRTSFKLRDLNRGHHVVVEQNFENLNSTNVDSLSLWRKKVQAMEDANFAVKSFNHIKSFVQDAAKKLKDSLSSSVK